MSFAIYNDIYWPKDFFIVTGLQYKNNILKL